MRRDLRGFAEAIFEDCTGIVIKFAQKSVVLIVESSAATFPSVQGESAPDRFIRKRDRCFI